MKVLIVHNRYRATAPSGENAVVDQEAMALSDRGHAVELFQRNSEEIANWSMPRRASLPTRVLWSGDSRRALALALAEFRPDVVHVHNTFPLLTPSILYACRDAAVPVVATIHNYKLGCANGELFRDGHICHDCLRGSATPALAHGCYRGSRLATAPIVLGTTVHAGAWRTMISAYMFISKSQRDLLAPLGLPADRSFVKYNFVPKPVPREGTSTEHQVAHVGRLDAAKGAEFLMSAWNAFRVLRPDSRLRLVVAGGGQLAEQVTNWAAQHDSATMLGHVPRQEVAHILAASRAVVVPSQWEETFGMVAVEAMATRTGVVASAHGAFPELVTTGGDGALFAPTDVSALVNILAEVDDRPELWDRYGERAAQTYRTRFSEDVGVDRLLSIYQFAIEHPVRPDRRRELFRTRVIEAQPRSGPDVTESL